MARKTLISALALSAAAALALAGCANKSDADSAGGDSEFPTKNITLVVPWNPGGDGDLSARTLAGIMEDELGVSIIVENRPGANGSIGFQTVKDAKPDGYTISMGSMESATLQFQDYDIKPEDFTFLGQASRSPGAIAVHVDEPYNTLDEMIAYAKANPGKLTYGTPGTGSVWDLPAHILMQEAGIEMQDVPFDGSAPSVAAAAAGHVNLTLNPIGLIAPHVEAGNMKFIAMLTDERHPDFPEVETATEAGYPIVHAAWVGMKVPAGTPEAVVTKLSDALLVGVESAEFKKVLDQANMIPTPRPFPEMDAYVLELAETFAPLYDRING